MANPSIAPPVSPLSFHRTTPRERGLMLATVALLPLENHIPSIGGFSFMFFIFLILAGYVAVNRLACLDQVWLHPVFVTAGIFVLIAGALEYTSPLSMYGDVARFTFAMCGAVIVACLCRDRQALYVGLLGYLCAGLWVSTVIFFTSFNVLSGGAATNFEDASHLRAIAFRETPLQANLNTMSLMSAQGAVVALALAFTGKSLFRRQMLLAVAGFCLMSSLLTMSRGGGAAALMSCAVVLVANGARYGRSLLISSILGTAIILIAPASIWSRMSFSTETQHGQMESRAYVYTTALKHLPEYVLAGVGAGNFRNKWGFENGFASGVFSYEVGGTHNSFLEVTVYWGLPGLFAFLALVWQGYRCLPRRCGNDGLALAILGITVSLGLWLLQSHNFYDKSFALGLGMLVASRRWIWPLGQVQETRPLESGVFTASSQRNW